MGFCKYCKKPIIDEHDMCNPDENGNGYHNECFVKMQFIMRDKAIYDKGKNDVLDKIIAEIEEYKSRQLTLAIGVVDLEKGKQIALEYVLTIIDKYKAESEDKV